MSVLNNVDKVIDDILKNADLEINPGLDPVLENKRTREMMKSFEVGLRRQLENLVSSNLFDEISETIGKAEDIFTESDEVAIQKIVEENLEPLEEDFDKELFIIFLIWVFNMGGQNFFNQNNIPAEFDLKNGKMISDIESHADMVLKDVDDVTTKMVSKKIVNGKQNGLSNFEISEVISDEIPDISQVRAERIVRTETSRMIGVSENETAKRNGASHKKWVTVSDPCPICTGNKDAGVIGVDRPFPSGSQFNPAHPNCRCLVEYVFTPFMGNIWSGQ